MKEKTKKETKKEYAYIIVIGGILLAGVGFILLKINTESRGIMLTLPYICIGFGCGIFGHGMGDVVSKRTLKNNPEIQKQMEINKNDERNITILNRAKAKAYDMMIFVFAALMISFALMGVDLTTILLFIFAYLFVIGYGIYYQSKYEKEM